MIRRFIPKHKQTPFVIALLLCTVFFIAYSVLSVVRHAHYQSLGYDLGINNQVVWRYSTFQVPITTSDPFPEASKLSAHVEFVYALIAPFYWIWSSPEMLLIVDALFMCASGVAVYLLARRRKLLPILSVSLVFSYLLFYGVQNAMWFDVHSASFAAGFIAWFIYFLESKKFRFAWVFLILAITAKENIGLLTILISVIYFLWYKQKQLLLMAVVSLAYVLFIYLIYFPYIIQVDYLYQNNQGLLSNLNPLSLFDSHEKREAIFYTLASFGFLPFIYSLTLLPAAGDFATYFILASDLKASHGIFMHYRVTLAPLMIWAVILTIARYKRLNSLYVAAYLLVCTLAVQYVLHLPLSYLTKSWFWTEPAAVKHINVIKNELQPNAAVVAQNNIIPHISQRDKIYTLYPEKMQFDKNSPCGQPECDWFRWHGKPEFLFVDTSPEWDARHFLTDRETYIKGLENIEHAGVVTKVMQDETAILYKVNKSP